jgi:nucleoside-diphosphate-sugar epimerase
MALKEKVFITGMAGFQAKVATKFYLDKGYEVGGIVRQSIAGTDAHRKIDGRASIYYADLRDYHSLAYALRDFQPDYVYHLAAITSVSYSFHHPFEVIETNFNGTVNLAEAARKELPSLKKFLFSSTMETYGVVEKEEPFTEKTPQFPNAPYAVAKLGAERYLQYLYFSYRFPSLSFRQTNVYGRQEDNYFVVEAIITKMLDNPQEIRLGKGDPIRNFIYIDDIIELEHIALVSDKKGEIYNTGPANGLTIKELAELIAKKLNWKGKIYWDTQEMRPGEIHYLNSTGEKAMHDFKWQPTYTLSTGLDRTIAYWQKHHKESDRITQLGKS